MNTPIKVLILEGGSADAKHLLTALRLADFAPLVRKVDSLPGFRAALSEDGWDIILALYPVANINGPELLSILRERSRDFPFIIVSDSSAQEVAVQCLKAGAYDFVHLSELSRLGDAATEALRESAQRRKRRIAEGALRESEERYRKLVESSPEATLILRLGQIVYINPAAVRLFGAQTPLDLVSRDCNDLIDSSSRAVADRQLADALEGSEDPAWECRMTTLDGRPLLTEIVARSITYHSEPAIQLLCRDITHRRRNEESIRHAGRMEAVARFASGVATDFNNLLTVIAGHVGLLRSALAGDAKLLHDLAQISSSAERALSLTQQLLSLSQKQALSPVVLNLNQVIEETRATLVRLLGPRISLLTWLSPDLGYVRADPSKIANLLLNLALRARDAMPEGGRLMIGTSNVTLPHDESGAPVALPAGHYVQLSIGDSGREIPVEAMPHLFEPFYEDKSLSPGVGLATASADAIARQHQGAITVQSKKAEGSTFRIYLPRDASAQLVLPLNPPTPAAMPATRPGPVMAVPSVEAPASKVKPANATILIAEDELALRDFAALILRRHGYNVLLASNGEEGLDLLEANADKVDLLFTDIIMPRLDGIELAKSAVHRQKNLRVLFTSGYARNPQIDESVINAGFLQKPYTSTELVQRVREMLSMPNPRNA